ncbi:MAG: hypothetical protein AB7O60_20310 [Variibacter sp.]
MPEIDPNKVPFLRPMKARSDSLPAFSALPTVAMRDKDGIEASVEHMDSLRIDVLKDAEETDLSSISNEFLRLLISNLRVASGQWWIGHPYAVFVGHVRNVFSIDRHGMPLDAPHSVTVVRTFGHFERPITRDIMRSAFSAALAGNAPSISEEYFLDAALEEAKGDYRKFVIDCATCCELERDTAFKRLWTSKNPTIPYRRGKVVAGNDLATHLDRDAKKLAARSLKEEHSTLWDALKSFWLLRGKVVHAEYQTRTEIKVEINRIGDLRDLTRRTVLWLRSLSPPLQQRSRIEQRSPN